MKKNNRFLLALLAGGLVFGSCNKELQRVNQNPNNLEHPDPTTMLSNTIVAEFYNNASIVWTLGNGYDQYMTFSQSYYDAPTRYQPVSNEPYWIPMYEAARDANTLYTLGQTNANPVLQAAALTLRSYAFAQLTELWGDIPFSEALQGNTGKYTPKYDSQQTVYTDPQSGILASLRRADSILKANSAGALSGDMLFSGNATSWRRFINALRLRYLLRVSSKMNVAAEMQSIVTDGTIMQSASQSGTLALPSTTPYNFVSITERSGDFNVKFMDSTLYSAFVTTADTARIKTFFAVNANNAAATTFNFSNYGGMPLVTDATAAQVASSSNFVPGFNNLSNPLTALTKARIMTYAEQQFVLAEAAEKGYITGNAATYYYSGIAGAYAEIGLSAANATSYSAGANVVYNTTSATAALQQIITQKWISNINNGFEGWIEYRRTGFPVFATGGSVNLNGGVIPTRFLYPTSEQTINSINYNTEVQTMGGKETTTYKAWWEK